MKSRFGVEHVLLCGSGTQALQLAFAAARLRAPRHRDLVALPSFTCYDVASAAIGARARVISYDVDPLSLTPDMDSLEEALRREPAAVVIAPLFGYQPDWDAVRALTASYGTTLVEDAAQSFGARWRGRPAGGLGDLSVLSFGRGKGWTAVHGGALLGPAEALERQSASLASPPRGSPGSTLGRGALQWAFARPGLFGIPGMVPGLKLGETVYHPPVAPHAPTPLVSRLAMATLDEADAEAHARRQRALILVSRLQQHAAEGVRLPEPEDGSDPGFLRLPVLTARDVRRRILARGSRLGVMPSYPRPLNELAQLRSHLTSHATYSGARTLADTLITVPTHSLVTEEDTTRIVSLLTGPEF